jgi:hypothetical protein
VSGFICPLRFALVANGLAVELCRLNELVYGEGLWLLDEDGCGAEGDAVDGDAIDPAGEHAADAALAAERFQIFMAVASSWRSSSVQALVDEARVFVSFAARRRC